LEPPPNAIEEPQSSERLDVVKHDRDTGSSLSQHAQNAKDSSREAARGPGERRVLNKNPDTGPSLRLKTQRLVRRGPAVLVPRNAANFELNIVCDECLAEVTAIIFDGVGGFVAASKQSDDALRGHFSTRYLPITRASIPELKKVRSASVGV